MQQSPSRLVKLLSGQSQLKWNVAAKGLLVGAASGLLAIIYRMGLEYGTDIAVKIYAWMKLHPVAILLWIAAIAGAGFLIAWLIRLEPMASGGGVPQVEGVILYGMKMKKRMVVIVRYIGGLLGSLFGLSFGPEGPAIQLGAAVSDGISKKICDTKFEENCLTTAGAAAGLSAAFGAPLTGTIFALEEIHRSFSPVILLSATAASLMSDFISKYFFGMKPLLYFQNVSHLPLMLYWWLIPLGIFVGLSGVATNRGILLCQTLFNKMPARFRPGAALLIALPCGLFLPEVLGGGRNLIDIIETSHYTLVMLATLFIVKILFTCSSIGSGAPGGLFMPIISISALSGSVFGMLAVHMGFPREYIPVFVICAMAGGLSSCVKAPVTSIILTIEMTGSVIYVLPVAVCSFIALLLSDLLNTMPIYEALLKRYIVKNGYTLSTEKRGELMEFPVEYGSEIAGRLLSDTEWPKDSLIVGLRRGSEELIPKGNTRIMAGDYLLIMAPQNRENSIRRKVQNLCHKN